MGELRKISLADLLIILSEHQEWLESGGEKGTRANLIGTDLHGANLRNSDLIGALFVKGVLCEADLSYAELGSSDMRGSDLSGANLEGADLVGAMLEDANLANANLTKTDLSFVDLSQADLRGAELAGANFHRAEIYKTKIEKREDLLLAKNIDSYEGFLFDEKDEEQTKQESEARDRKAERELRPEEKGLITFSLPSSYSLTQVGRVLGLLGLLTEGVRLALTTDFNSAQDLSMRVMQPELFEVPRDKYAAELIAINKGSVDGQIVLLATVASTIIGVAGLWVKYKLEKTKLAITNKVANQQAVDQNRRYALDVISSEHVPEELKKEAEEVIKNNWGSAIDISEQQTIAVSNVVGFTMHKWMLIKEKKGGQILIGDKPFGGDAEN